MYNMEINVFGIKARLEIIVVCLLLGAFIGCHVLCSCAKFDNVKVAVKKEGMVNMGAPTNYKMGTGVQGSWDTRSPKAGGDISWRRHHHETYKGTPVPLPEGQLFMFADNEFKPGCCNSSISGSTGCACITKKQIDYINQRGVIVLYVGELDNFNLGINYMY